QRDEQHPPAAGSIAVSEELLPLNGNGAFHKPRYVADPVESLPMMLRAVDAQVKKQPFDAEGRNAQAGRSRLDSGRPDALGLIIERQVLRRQRPMELYDAPVRFASER